MLLIGGSFFEVLAAFQAEEVALVRVSQEMLLQTRLELEHLAADVAWELGERIWLVNQLVMHIQAALADAPVVAFGALVGFLSRVSLHVELHGGVGEDLLTAYLALDLLLGQVHFFHVDGQAVLHQERFFAEFAVEREHRSLWKVRLFVVLGQRLLLEGLVRAAVEQAVELAALSLPPWGYDTEGDPKALAVQVVKKPFLVLKQLLTSGTLERPPHAHGHLKLFLSYGKGRFVKGIGLVLARR